jgi:iron complex transport system ATP-binding protein
MIDGVGVTVDEQAVVLTADQLLSVVSSAPVRGGVVDARAFVNLHVGKHFAHVDLEAEVDAFARARELPQPWIGFLTAAATERAEVVWERVEDVVALAVVTVGLSRPIAAATSAPVDAARVGTINAIVVVDATLETAALVNAVMTVAEVKTAVLGAAGLRADGAAATGTATDAIAVAATQRGPRYAFAGPCTVPGSAVARAVQRALQRGVVRWIETHS